MEQFIRLTGLAHLNKAMYHCPYHTHFSQNFKMFGDHVGVMQGRHGTFRVTCALYICSKSFASCEVCKRYLHHTHKKLMMQSEKRVATMIARAYNVFPKLNMLENHMCHCNRFVGRSS